MQFSLKDWKYKWLVALAFIGISVGIVTAYFTGSSWLRGQVLGTSSLAIQVEQIEPQTFSMFVPGEPQQFVWKIVNSGDTPVNLAARFIGTWQKPGIDSSMFKLQTLTYKISGTQAWQPIALDSITGGQPWFFSPSGEESGLVVLTAGSELEVRGELMLDNLADNSYQLADFPFSLEVIAKQTLADAAWPEYE